MGRRAVRWSLAGHRHETIGEMTHNNIVPDFRRRFSRATGNECVKLGKPDINGNEVIAQGE